jgi:hypothetical protein
MMQGLLIDIGAIYHINMQDPLEIADMRRRHDGF